MVVESNTLQNIIYLPVADTSSVLKFTIISVCAWPSSICITNTTACPSSSVYAVGLKPTVTAVFKKRDHHVQLYT